MNSAVIEITKDDTLTINGQLDFGSAEKVYQQGKLIIQDRDQSVFDLASISKSDSAGLATLIAWQNYSIKHNKRIKFINLPKQMLSIARLCGLQDII